VGKTSIACITCDVFVPGFRCPGHFITAGTRVPPSLVEPLAPRSGKFRAPKFVGPPLSLVAEEHHQRVLRHALLFQRLQHAADVVV